MSYSVLTSDQAKQDLKNICEYIAFTLLSPINAGHQLDRLEKSIMGLDMFPERFRKYENEPWKSRGLHIMPVDNYCVLYIHDEETNTVTIIRVIFSSRDIDTVINEF